MELQQRSIATNGNAGFAGIVTAGGGFNIGIQSAGIVIAKNVGINTLNFVGSGNSITYFAATNTLDVSIAGSSGGGGGVSQRHQHQFQAQVPQAQVVLRKHLNDLHQFSLRLHKDQHIRWVDIWSYMMARLLQPLKNQQSQLDQCLEHLRVLSMVMTLNSELR